MLLSNVVFVCIEICHTLSTMERLQQAGGNIDYVRFCEEILIPLHEGRTFSFLFNCKMLQVNVWA